MKEATFVFQKVLTKGRMAKDTTFYERTGRTKTTCQDVVALIAVELEFTMAGSKKTADV